MIVVDLGGTYELGGVLHTLVHAVPSVLVI